MSHFQDAFISYGRADSKVFAKKLNDCLVEQGLEVWFDFDDIPLGVDYQNQINSGIERADNFLFIISPHAVHSPYCAKEIDRALKRNKRIIPLMHVEQISWETWQKRHSEGTWEEWEAYRSKGFHSCFPSLHPAIARINWVYFREEIDDFERSLADLLVVLERDRSYVRQHTHWLTKALEWERHHKQARYLLVGEERQRAEAWLSFKLEDEPPCIATDLHCEFITESIKNANNLMTQVFLSWSDQDAVFMEQLRHTLMREGFTLWVSRSDIKTGADFQRLINRGIEEADNIVYLISPDSLQSKYCQQEINYALSLNKRIIPTLICSTDLEQIPPELRELQFINFADNTTPKHYHQDVASLIKTLRQDAVYYEEHKILLAKALKWERQHRNPCMLLRGYNLRHAEAWLKVAQQREQHQPIPLQETFIQESLRQPAGVSLDVFISYSRQDSEFARRLNEALQIQGKTTWFDQESIAAGSADFQQEIYRGIESAHHVLFILSPSAINSPYCGSEVEYAASLNKRIVTVLHRSVNPASLPAALASVQWIDFNQKGGDFDANLSVLLRTLDTDPEHLRNHTWLLVRSLEWDSKNRDESLLLRGSTLKQVREWLLSSEQKSPQPTRLQRDYVTASNAIEIQRQRSALRLQQVGLGIISTISLVAIVLGLTAFKQYRAADRLKLQAQSEKIIAQTHSSEALFQSDRIFDALLEAMGAGIQVQRDEAKPGDLQASVLTALQQAVFWVRERQRIDAHAGIIWAVSVSPDGKLIASASADGTVKVWQREGALVRTLASQHRSQMLAVAFSPDRQYLATADSSGRVTLWHLGSWTPTALAISLEKIESLAFSPDGRTLAAGGEDTLIRLWRRNQNGRWHPRPEKTLAGHDAAVRSVAFSPDGQLVASASDDRSVRLWQKDGTPLKTLIGHTAQVRSVSFSPDVKRLVSGSWDETIRLWRRDGTPLNTLRGHETLIHDAHFTPDGKTIASAGWDKTIKLWTLDGVLISTLSGHSGQVRQIAFNPIDGKLVSVGGDRTIRIWQLRRPLLAVLQGHRANVYSVAFAPDGKLLASAGADDTVRLWDRQGHPLRRLSGHQSVVWSVRFSPDGQRLVSASSDYTVKLWNRQGKLLKTLEGHAGPVYYAEFSPDGKLIASASADQTVRIWRSDGTLVRTLREFNRGVLTVHFSRDGRTLATSGWDNGVQLWTLDGNLRTILKGHQGWVYDVSFSHDGSQILTGSYDSTANLWTSNGKLLTTLKGHEDGVVAVRFSQDDQLLLTASHDHTVKLWRRDGTLITTLRGHSDRVSDASFSPDAKLLATASEDHTVLLWHLDFQGELDKLLAQGCHWAQDYLHTNAGASRSEIQQFCDANPPTHSSTPQVQDDG